MTASLDGVRTLREKFAEDDRSFAKWCKQVARDLPDSKGFYLPLAKAAEKRVREYKRDAA